ncbi:MAG: branched-chain amino acid ABC transporter permease [Thermodesulfobacteriota bacterium]|nr:branched-chain amino acid ABC transporter permease [Thermodesulfobacteriota bacterium]
MNEKQAAKKSSFLNQMLRSVFISVWFMFLTFPIMVIRVNPIEQEVEWRWKNLVMVGGVSFFFSFIARRLLERKKLRKKSIGITTQKKINLPSLKEPRIYIPFLVFFSVFVIAFPFIFSMYQTSIMTTALMYVVLGLGLNIVVGMAGLLDLGYVAFYAVGAYSYALLNYHYGLGFWSALPIGAALGAILGIILGFPVLRLRGDYLAIVTLGFGEIIRLILENWNEFSFGPSGIANIARPSFFEIDLSLKAGTIYLYFLMIGLTLFTIFVVNRLRNSRVGRAWIALKEDEIACQAMGIDKTKTKLTAFALGATWAGMVGVIFAAKTTFINPASFTFLESAIILSVVVLGGMGSIAGVIIGALILILLPEYLRAFSDYRMLLFGAIMVIMMVFRPQGIISNVRRTY